MNCIKVLFSIACISTFLILPDISSGQALSHVLEIKNERQLFIDDFIVDSLLDVRIKMHHPYYEGPSFYYDKSWEGPFAGYTTIIKDGNLFRAYYRGSQGGKDGNDREVTCVSESLDGIHWIKPDVGIYKWEGNSHNNIVLAHEAPSSHNFSPFIDKNPDCEGGEKYKALSLGNGGLMAWVSPDGIHWKKIQNTSVISKGAFDSQNVAFWSETEKMYVCYFRTWTKGNFKGIRTVSRTTSRDFIHWSEPVQMSFGNTSYEEIYIQQTSPYYRAPQIYLAIGARFMPGREVITPEDAKALDVNPNYFGDISDAIIMSTRGGDNYNRYFMESFIRPGLGLDNWVSRTNYPALNVVQTSEKELSIYMNKDYAQPTSFLGRYSLRIDGFASVNGGYEGGFLITKPFIFSGKELEINYSTSAAGEIKIEFQDEKGTPIDGYTLDESNLIIGDQIKKVISWNGETNLKKLNDKVVRLRIYLKDADLYSFKFNN